MGAVNFLHHICNWLIQPDHSGVISALTTIVLGPLTLIFLIAGTHAARQQAKAANAQAFAGRVQLREDLRPVVTVQELDHSVDGGPALVFTNQGPGTAQISAVDFFAGDSLEVASVTVSTKVSLVLPVHTPWAFRLEAQHENRGAAIFYESMMGTRYCTAWYRTVTPPVLAYLDPAPYWPLQRFFPEPSQVTRKRRLVNFFKRQH